MPFLATAPALMLFVLIGGVIAFVVFAASRHNQAVNEAWQSSAKRLGLRYKKGGFKRKLEGEYRGFDVRVNTFTQSAGNNSQSFTRYRVSYPNLGLGLELKHQHFFATLGRALTGGKDIVIGDQEFDDTVIVEARLAREVIAFLTPERRLRIVSLITSQRRALIRDDEASFVTKGTVSDAAKIQRHLDRLVILALSLTGQDDDALSPALTARSEGDLGSAIALAGAAHAAAPEDQDARLMHSELLSNTGQHEEAHEVLHSQPIDEDDAELTALAESLEAKLGFDPSELSPPPIVRAPEAAPAPVPLEPPVFAEPAPEALPADAAPEVAATPEPAESTSASEPVDYHELRADLFETNRMSFEVKDHFDATYAGRTPTWRGKLERLSDYNSDMVFEGGPGTKAMVALEPIQDGSFAKDVRAVVQLTREQAEAAKSLVGSEVTLTGRLVSCDGFMRNLFLASGTLAS